MWPNVIYIVIPAAGRRGRGYSAEQFRTYVRPFVYPVGIRDVQAFLLFKTVHDAPVL